MPKRGSGLAGGDQYLGIDNGICLSETIQAGYSANCPAALSNNPKHSAWLGLRATKVGFVGVVFLHPTTTRRQAGGFMLLIVSLSNGLNRNPQPLSARRISITQGTGSVWLTTV